MTDPVKGVLAMIVACTIWGLSPLYYAQIRDVPPLEVLCYRAIWSLIFFAAILLFQGRLRLVWAAVTDRESLWVIVLAGLLISSNWGVFIYAIGVEKGVDASLGYYMFPLMTAALGFLVFGERLSAVQWFAIGLSSLAVVVLSIGLQVIPFIALYLGGSFAAYGVLKKRLSLGPVVSVTAEVFILTPVALLWIANFGTQIDAGWGRQFYLALSGPITATPLILLSFAARRIKLSTVGVVQLLNPTLQFGCATLVFLEPFTIWHGIAFPLMWGALIIYSIAQVRQDRASRKAV